MKSAEQLLRYGQKDMKLHKRETKYNGFFKLEQYQVSHKLYSGAISEVFTREVFERGDAVVVIPYDSTNDTVVLIEQFRVGAIRGSETPWMLEFVAGMIEEDEQPIDVAIRESKEEANLHLNRNKIEKVIHYFSSPGGTTEGMYVYVADIDSADVGGVYGLDHENEDILVHKMSREQAYSLIAQGKITNAATLIGLQWLQLNYIQLQKRWQNK